MKHWRVRRLLPARALTDVMVYDDRSVSAYPFHSPLARLPVGSWRSAGGRLAAFVANTDQRSLHGGRRDAWFRKIGDGSA